MNCGEIMRGILNKLICSFVAAALVLCLTPMGATDAQAKKSTFVKNGFVYGIIGEVNEGRGIVSVLGIDENAEKDAVCDLTVPSEVRKNKITYEVISISGLAFSGLSGIKSIVISEGVTEAGAAAFYMCKDLASITIPASLIKLGGHSFGGCCELAEIIVSEENEAFMSEEGILYSKDGKKLISATGVSGDLFVKKGVETICGGAFEGNDGITSVSLPSSVKKVEECAFYNCSALKSIDLKKAENIGKEAFAGSGLKSVTIPASTTSISGNPFMFCKNLKSIEVSKKNTKYAAVNGFLLNSSGSKLISGSAASDSSVIPDAVKTIGKFAFAGNERIVKFTLPSGVTRINEGAFCYCTSLNKFRFTSRKITLADPADESYGIFFNTDYDLVVEVPYSEKGFTKGSLERSIEGNSPLGVDITTY